MTAPIKTCDYCCAMGVMPTFMDGETVCYDCLPTLPKTMREARREVVLLRAKVEQMERQEPVGHVYRHGNDSHGGQWHGVHWYDPNLDVPTDTKLYTLPGAQPAPSASSIEAELLRQSILGLVNQYGDERAIEAYHGDLHCRKAPKDLFAEIERALETLSAPSVPDGFVWPECPKRRQSHVLFDDGYEEGWAACISTVKAMLNAAPNPEE